MAVNLSNATKDAVMTAIRDECADGDIRIGTSGMASVLSTHGLSASAGSIASQAWTLALDAATVAAAATGTAAEAEIRDSGGTVRISGLTVGTSGTDVILDDLTITSGQNVTINSGVITHA